MNRTVPTSVLTQLRDVQLVALIRGIVYCVLLNFTRAYLSGNAERREPRHSGDPAGLLPAFDVDGLCAFGNFRWS
jgi:hypothetical protein